jgi:Na+-transporting NADH:ubiquinone oxidoreductase subunit B
MSGDKVWVEGAVERTREIAAGANLDAISGETILGSLAQGKQVAFSTWDMFMGFIPGSVGETSTILILLGGLFLIFTKIGSWRIMLSSVLGAITMGLIFNQIVDAGIIAEGSKFYGLMSTPFWEHLIIGGFAFGVVFMATDPVTASQTNKGKWYYGFFVGFISILIRVFNPAYPEGVMLAILLMNVFAPTIDHYVVQGNIKQRKKRLKAKIA